MKSKLLVFILSFLICTRIIVSLNLSAKIQNIAHNNIKNIPSYERLALQDFYHSTNGNNWIYPEGTDGYWNFTDPKVNPCLPNNTWQGLNCTTISSISNYYYISEIHLSEYGLNGTISDTIGNFTQLKYLDISNNTLYGSIPNSIGNLSKLIELDLSKNHLHGTLPNSLYNLLDIKYLSLSQNVLEGTISKLIGQLSELTYLNILTNNFYGTIPNSVGNLTNLILFSIAKNKLTGSIPNTLQKLTNLSFLGLNYNVLTGTIPAWIGNFKYLNYFAIGNNLITGTIPSSITNLSFLLYLNLGNNKLSGSIPDVNKNMLSFTAGNNELTSTIPQSLCNADHLLTLVIRRNQLSGTIPECIGELNNLTFLDLGNNSFLGPIPTTFTNRFKILLFRVSLNILSGTIPDIFTNSNHLVDVQLNDNLFTGTIPTSMMKLRYLGTLLLQNNHFSGNVANLFDKNMMVLNNVHLSNNQFSGTLPEQAFLTYKLQSFSAVSNCLHGSIPSSICMNYNLETLALDGLACASSCRNKILPALSDAYISDNQITGGIPDCIWNMPKLTILHLSGNSLTGSLSNNISTQLMDLSLSYNILTGSIPKSIQERVWDNLDLSHNRISGSLSSNFASQNKSSSLSLNNNRISGTIPNNLKNMKDIDILKGNYYDCSYDRSDLPTNDNDKDTYECGSDDFNILYYIWLGIAVVILAIIFLLWRYRDEIDNYFPISSIIKKLSRYINIVQYLETNSEIVKTVVNKIKDMKYLKQYNNINHIFMRFSIYCSIFIILILLPVYLVLSSIYRENEYQYAWTASLTYVSGKIPFSIGMSFLIIFIFAQLYFYVYIISIYSNYTLCSIADDYNPSIDRQLSIPEKSQSHNRYISKIYQMLCDSKKYSKWRIYDDKNKWTRYGLYTTYIFINLIVSTGVNVAYVYVALYQSKNISTLGQILLSIFKIFWNNIISPKMVKWIIEFLSMQDTNHYQILHRRLFLMLFMVSLFNNIIIPCITVVIISPNCLFYAFSQEADVTSSFKSYYCSDTSAILCTKLSNDRYRTSYSPPYTYSYQCSADFVTYYASVFMFMCIISTFIIPILRFCLLKLSKKYNMISNYFGKFLFEIRNLDNCSQLLSINFIYGYFVSQLTIVAILLTFGAVFPPLAIALLITIYRRMYYQSAIIGRCILNLVESKKYDFLDIIENDFKVIPLLSTIRLCGWILLFVCCLFYAPFLFDILGDDVGAKKAYWIFIVMPCIPICMYIIYKSYKYWLDGNKSFVNKFESENDIELYRIESIITSIENPLSVTSTAATDDK